jgi:4-hydroxybenzoate polyprenyltransferase
MFIFHRCMPYISLMRLDKPVGIWLLFWPCLWGLGLGAWAEKAEQFDLMTYGYYAALFFIGSVLMRSAGCIYNDIIDRDLDKSVARTSSRPLASGVLTVKQAVVAMIVVMALAAIVIVPMPPLAQIIAVVAVIPVLIYPLMKRITHWPQIFLGITFNWGILVGYAAARGALGYDMAVLYLAAVFWTLAYDTIYALQDIEDDIKIGVKSSAIAVGGAIKKHLFLWHILVLSLLMAIGVWHGLSAVYFGFVFVVMCHFLWQIATLSLNSPSDALYKFKSNMTVGGLVALSFFMEYWRG